MLTMLSPLALPEELRRELRPLTPELMLADVEACLDYLDLERWTRRFFSSPVHTGAVVHAGNYAEHREAMLTYLRRQLRDDEPLVFVPGRDGRPVRARRRPLPRAHLHLS